MNQSPSNIALALNRARTGVGSRGGKTRWRNGNQLFNVLAQCRLVVFNRQRVVGAVLENQTARRLILSVERIQDHQAALQFYFGEELARHRYFVGLGIDYGAAQIELADTQGVGDSGGSPGAVGTAGI